MVQDTLETRVARLEEQVHFLIGNRRDLPEPAADDWKRSVGMFRGDEVVREMIEHAEQAREEEQNRVRNAPDDRGGSCE